MRFIGGLALCAALATWVQGEARAQAYPARPVKIVIPFTPGGGSDVVARILAQKIAEATGQSFVADNRPGAGGNIAFEYVAHAEPDGYTILNSTPGIVINPTLYRKVNFKVDDFIAVSLIGKAPLLLVVHPSLPARTVSELVKLAKARPGAIRFASAGTGSSSHLASEVFRTMTGIDLVHVPYKGGPQAMHDVISGQLEMLTLPFPETLPQVRAGRVRALAQTGDKRASNALDIPTMDEAGVKGYSVTTWYVIFGPAGMPAAVVARLHELIVKALKIPEVQERLRVAGVGEIVGSTPEQAAQFVKSEFTRWAQVIQAADAKAD